MKLIIRNSNGEITEQEINENMQFNPTAGEQYFFTGVENYTFNLTENNTSLDIHFLDSNGERVNVVLHDMAELIQQNNSMDDFSIESTFGVSTNQAGDQAIQDALDNKDLDSGEIVEALKDALSMDGTTLAGGAVIDDFQGLLNALDATATGEVQNTAYNPLFDGDRDQDVDPIEENAQDRPDSYGDRDDSIERAEGSYGTEQVETQTTEAAQEAVAVDSEADLVIASIDVGEANITSSIVDVEALRELGYTIDNDGNFYEINEDAPKVLVEQEFEREVIKVVEVDPIMKEATETTTVETIGEAYIDDGAVISSNSGVNFDFAEATSNIELDFNNFNSGNVQVSFYDSEGNQIGDSVTTSNTNGAQDYVVPDGAVGITVYNNTDNDSFEVETISYRGEPQTVTVETGGLVPDYEAMEAAGYTWGETESITLVQTEDITQIGNVGNNQVDGFNPEDTETSQVFDFGPALANQMVTITIDMEVKGSWDNNVTSTNDYFSISANGNEVDVHHYSDDNNPHETDDVEVINSGGTDQTYTYEVYLDENGQVQLEFMVASTATGEVVNIENIEVAYEGVTGWMQETTVTETFTESVLVDAPASQVDPSDIPGGVPTIVEAVEYPIDLMAKLTDTDGSESLSDITVDNLPEGTTLTGDNVTDNGDGTYSVAVDENGEAQAVLKADAELDNAEIESISTEVTATESESGDTATISVNGSGEFAFLDDVDAVDFGVVADNAGDVYKVNLEAETSQTLSLNVEDVVTSNDDHEMVIVGNNGDVIELEGEGWTKEEGVSVDGEDGSFDHYTSTSNDGTVVDVYVESEITVQTDDFF